MGGSRKKTMTDFKVIKKKVGKKAKPANETSTRFESKQIIIREQSVVSNLNSEESTVSSRGLTVDQLAHQTRHYNPKVRKEAFAQLEELAVRVLHSAPIRKSFGLCIEALADSGMRDLDQDARRAFHQLLLTLFQQQQGGEGFQLTPLQHGTLINLMFVCLTEGEGIDRRLDATRVLELLVQYVGPEALSSSTVDRIVACYADLCRTVLGTNSSSLAKREAGVLVRKGLVGKIMTQMKEQEKLDRMNKKLKRSKTTESSIVALENAVDTQRLIVVAKGALLATKLLQGTSSSSSSSSFKRLVLPLLLAALEVFRHAVELGKPEALLPCAEALWRLLDQYAGEADVTQELCGDIQRAFEQAGTSTRVTSSATRAELQRLECLACFAAHQVADKAWLADTLDWFVGEEDAGDDDETINERLWFTPGLLQDKQTTDRVLQSFVKRYAAVLQTVDGNSAAAASGLRWRLQLVMRLLRSSSSSSTVTMDATIRLALCKDLPRALWTLAGGSVLAPAPLPQLAADTCELVELGLQVLRQCALLVEEDGEQKEWAEIARSLAFFYAALSPKQQAVALGPFFRFPSALRADLVGLVAVLPIQQLPAQLLKNWCQTLLQPHGDVVSTLDGQLLIETAFQFAKRQAAAAASDDDSAAEMILSFALTCALKTAHTTLVCSLIKSLWRNTEWSVAELIAPAVIEARPATSTSDQGRWLEFASAVVACAPEAAADKGSELQELRAMVGSAIAHDWRLLVARPQILLHHLHDKMTPEEVVGLAGEEEEEEAEAPVAGWVDFLLHAVQNDQQVPSAWAWGASPKLQAQAAQLAANQDHAKLASNLKLLLLAVDED